MKGAFMLKLRLKGVMMRNSVNTNLRYMHSKRKVNVNGDSPGGPSHKRLNSTARSATYSCSRGGHELNFSHNGMSPHIANGKGKEHATHMDVDSDVPMNVPFEQQPAVGLDAAYRGPVVLDFLTGSISREKVDASFALHLSEGGVQRPANVTVDGNHMYRLIGRKSKRPTGGG